MQINRIHEPNEDDIAENQKKRKMNGYAPNPFCKVCYGLGRVHPVVGGQVMYDSTEFCKAKDCLSDAIQHWKESGQYLELKGVSTRMQTFEQFNPIPGTEKCLEAFRQLAEGRTDKPLLLCYGGVGNGKTHLMQAATTTLNKRGINAYYYRVPDLLKTLRASMATHDTDEWIKSLSETGALLMDDYGLENQTDWALATIEDIVDARWQEKRITVMTTNKDIKDLPSRLQSRFRDVELSVAVLNAGRDYRVRRK